MLTGENGILTQAEKAKEETENAQAEEENILANYESYLNSYSGENTEFTDRLGNKVIVPAGFKIVNPEDNVEDGIIIEDVTHGATAGSQFVWIPVGENIKKSNGSTFDIKLSRYTFAEDGTSTNQGNKIIETYYQELNTGKGNATAKENIESEEEGFIKSVIANGGYYIGRYEARDRDATLARTSSTSDVNQLVCVGSNYVYNYVTQLQAASLSQNMYNDSNFKSDLVNSYAWDTAIEFLQKCDDRTNKTIAYSRQNSLNETLAEKGTNNQANKDIICNIYDMASNCFEWTTETSSYDNGPWVARGGVCSMKDYYTAFRGCRDTKTDNGSYSFRPIIYLSY